MLFWVLCLGFQATLFNDTMAFTLGEISLSMSSDLTLKESQERFSNDKLPDTLQLTLSQVEQLFLENNLMLLAQRYDIKESEALVRQARLWNNPEISISEVNLHRIPPGALFDDLSGRPQQFSIEIEQLISTAGKRSRLVKMQQLETQIRGHVFDDILRALKFEVRQLFATIDYKLQTEQLLLDEFAALQRLIQVMERQYESDYISLAELMRLQTLMNHVRIELSEIRSSRLKLQHELAMLLRLDVDVVVMPIAQELPNGFQHHPPPLPELISMALQHRPDLLSSRVNASLYETSIGYERAMAVPDVTIGAMYDRWGGIAKDYIGFGLSFDLPLFNRNQGSINAARVAWERETTRQKQLEQLVGIQVAKAYRILLEHQEMLEQTAAIQYQQQQEVLQQVLRNYESRNIGLLEFVDYFTAYRESREQSMRMTLQTLLAAEELNFAVGMDVIEQQ